MIYNAFFFFLLNWEGLYTLSILRKLGKKKAQYWKYIQIVLQSRIEENRNWDHHIWQLFCILNTFSPVTIGRKPVALQVNLMKNDVSITPQ